MLKSRFFTYSAGAIISSSLLLTGCANTSIPSNANSPEGVVQEEVEQSNQTTSNVIKSDEIQNIFFSEEHITISPESNYLLVLYSLLTDQTEIQVFPEDIIYEIQPSNLAVIEDNGLLTLSNDAVTGNTFDVVATYEGFSTQLTITVKYNLEDTIIIGGSEIPQITNQESIAVLVNKQRSLKDEYVPTDLVQPNIPFSFAGESEKKWLREEAARALEQLFEKADQENIQLNGVSGYRSYLTQKSIFNWNVQEQGEEQARRYSAFPGTSEHQTGLAIDVSSPSVNNVLHESLGSTKEGQWLAKHAAEFGFIIRYPQDKEHITGYAYEPWHIRYVGKEIAAEIMGQNSTLEEYFNESTPVSTR
ncbi:M15 family metallopeptidase [Chengkuizengella sediminis]|uniref:M15 family metallopeptidase n=1 Tax=Chengkuizengella sediminis TaxID=1885917 RepID=UPI0013894AE2|nr:M15 family metallopeptidase [Chengkuizengella sediminis]NDI35882.1 M15 family metallopeptidase [Chengkuizengella sediminis]